MEDDGFTFVTSSRGRRRKHRKIQCPLNLGILDYKGKDLINYCSGNKLEEIKNVIKLSELYSSFTKDLIDMYIARNSASMKGNAQETSESTDESTFNKPSQNLQIVCYGLGKFTSCYIALYQLAFLILIKEEWKPTKLYIYDPQFTEGEIAILHKLEFDVLEINERASRKVSCDTLFFMPHCDLPLYDNLLIANWSKENLQYLIIVGNSFRNYNLMPEKSLKRQAFYVYQSLDFATEVPLSKKFKYEDIFNDLSIHYFKSDELSKVPDDVWHFKT